MRLTYSPGAAIIGLINTGQAEMQIRKSYREISPELLYNEVRDFVQKQGVVIDKSKMETYSLPGDSSTFISRGLLVFKTRDESGKPGRECFTAHIIGSARGETRVMLDIDEALFPAEKVAALEDYLTFFFSSYEAAAH